MAVISKGSIPSNRRAVYYGPTPGYLNYLDKYATDDERVSVLDSIYSYTHFTPYLSLSSYRTFLSRLNLSKHDVEFYDTPSFIRRYI